MSRAITLVKDQYQGYYRVATILNGERFESVACFTRREISKTFNIPLTELPK